MLGKKIISISTILGNEPINVPTYPYKPLAKLTKLALKPEAKRDTKIHSQNPHNKDFKLLLVLIALLPSAFQKYSKPSCRFI